MNKEKELLYRKEKKTGLSRRGHIQTGQEYRWQRNTKEFGNSEAQHEAMNPGKYGYDYTPLCRFLLSRVGQPWEPTYHEAQTRLKGQDYGEKPIWWMVAQNESERDDWGYSHIGEHSMWSQLYVDDESILQISKPEARGKISCSCCTHSFNGKVLDPNVRDNWYNPDNFDYGWFKNRKERRRENKLHKKHAAERQYDFRTKEEKDAARGINSNQ